MRALPVLLILLTTACTLPSTRDTNDEIEEFLVRFENSLSYTDEILLTQFQTTQSMESILAAIHVLQKRLEPGSGPLWKLATSKGEVQWENDGYKVKVPVIYQEQTSNPVVEYITFWLRRDQETFQIIRLDAAQFFTNQSKLALTSSTNQEYEDYIQSMQVYLNKATDLLQHYDSVAWFVRLPDQSALYYVINRDSSNESLMGVVDDSGKVIIPANFDLIGTPDVVFEGLVEVTRMGKIGYYGMNGHQYVSPQFDLVIPYNKLGILAIVRNDSTYGWLDPAYAYHKNFPSEEAKQHVLGLRFFATPFEFAENQYSIGQRPNEMALVNGILIPPAYMVHFGVFPKIINNLKTDAPEFYEATVYVEAETYTELGLADQLRLVINSFRTRFIGGREEFYSSGTMAVVNSNLDTLSSSAFYPGKTFSVQLRNDSLLELSILYDDWGGQQVSNFPQYEFFSLKDGKLEELKPERNFALTQFVMLDSSYLSGQFKVWDKEWTNQVDTQFLPASLLTELRDDVLAANGYIFPDSVNREYLKYNRWYHPTTSSIDEILLKANPIDKHNLLFLEKVLGILESVDSKVSAED